MMGLAVLLTLAAPFALGTGIVRLRGLGPKADALAWAGYSYLTGTFASGLLLAALLAFGAPLSALLVDGLIFGTALVLHLLARRAPAPDRAPEPPDAPLWQRIALGATLGLLLLVGWDRVLLSSAIPVVKGDEGFIWAARAKILFHAGGLNDRFRAETRESIPGIMDVASHPDYPALNSLLQLLAYVNAGRITQVENRLPIQMFAFATLLVLAAALRRLTNPLFAAALLVLLTSERFSVDTYTFAMADGMVALGLVCAADCLLRESRDRTSGWTWLGGCSLAFLAWSKHEGAMLVAILAVVVLVTRPWSMRRLALRQTAIWVAPASLILALTWITNAALGFQNDIVQGGDAGGSIVARLGAGLASRGPEVASLFLGEFAASSNVSRLLLFPLLLGLLLPSVRGDRRLVALVLAIVAAILGYLAVFVASPNELSGHWATAGQRVLSQLNATIALLVGAVTGIVAAAQPVRAQEKMRSL